MYGDSTGARDNRCPGFEGAAQFPGEGPVGYRGKFAG
ncbi:hypothetical protein ABZ897_54215 [Nonomuraea sp. NPDC046802]